MKTIQNLVHIVFLFLSFFINAQNYTPYQESIPYTLIFSSSGGGSFSINIEYNTLVIGGSGSCNPSSLNTGQIYHFNAPYTIPDVSIGFIKTTNGQDTSYFVTIENNWLVISSDTNEALSYIQFRGDFDLTPDNPNDNNPNVSTPSMSENYIYDLVANYPTNGNLYNSMDNVLNSFNLKEGVIQNVSYFDGLGKGIQNQQIASSPSGNDVIEHMTYDELGRKVKTFLPFPSIYQNNGSYIEESQATSQLNQYYLANYGEDLQDGLNPYSETIIEKSPLERIIKQAAPGSSWKAIQGIGSDHTIKFLYEFNSMDLNDFNADNVLFFGVDFPLFDDMENTELIIKGYVQERELYKTVTKDENWTSGTNHTTEEFQDKQGRVVLKRAYAQVNGASTRHDTYYVYDDYGNLTYVLSPEGSAKILAGSNILQEVLDDFCYQYRYDHRNRLVEKRIPGKDWEHIVYNKLDQPVMTRDMMLYLKKNVLFTNYDAFGRVAYTGMLKFSAAQVPRNTLQGYADGLDPITVSKTEVANDIDGTTIHYTQLPLPNDATVENLFTINYYDDYSFDMPGITAPSDVFGIAPSTRTKGLPTGSKVRVLDTADWITTVTWYDDKGRAICTVSKNPYLGTIDTVEMELDFVGKVIRTERTHIKGTNVPIMITERYVYDHMGRMLSHTHQIDNGLIELVAVNHYDELGRLDSKKVGGSSAVQPEQSNGLQTVDYRYNIRGWLKSINNPSALGSDLFGFEIGYNDPTVSGAVPLFNGNISETLWRTDNIDNGLKSYKYEYDALNRIKKGIDNTLDERYSLKSVSYDQNGNITSLSRNGHMDTNATLFGNMDNLSYSYQGNQLMTIRDWSNTPQGFKDDQLGGGSDTSVDYSYDKNGNITSDTNKGIVSIEYNHLNLPVLISIPEYHQSYINREKIYYVYDAHGNKLEKEVYHVNNYNTYSLITEYNNIFIYKYQSSRGLPEPAKLALIKTPEGYFNITNPYAGISSGDYVYQYKDHLGNIRLSYNDMNNDGLITGTTIEIFSDDFETASGWDGSGASWGWPISDFDDGRKYNGNFSGKVTALQGTSIAVHSNEWVPVNNSSATEYIYSAWAYSESPIIRLGLAMKEDGETGYVTLFDDVQVLTTHKWVYVEKRISVPVNITSLNIRIESAAWGNKVGSVWFDNVSIRRVNDVNEIEIVQENNYYPFGLEHKGYNSNVILENNYFNFNGKELNKSLGLNIIEMDFRQYDPALGRFNVIDPLAEERDWLNPYNFVQNNPISRVDPTGLLDDDYGLDKKTGNISLIKKTDDKTDTLYAGYGVGVSFVKDKSKGSVTVNQHADGNSVISDLSVGNGKVETVATGEDSTKERTSNITHTNNADDAFNVFKFVADNSNVEWSIHKFTIDNRVSSLYQIGTYHESNLSPKFDNQGVGAWLGGIHSHPNQNTAQERSESLYGDRSAGSTYLNKYGRNLPYHIYFPSTGKASRVRLSNDPLFPKAVTIENNINSYKF